jgi:ATP-dependent DNA helicase RecG
MIDIDPLLSPPPAGPLDAPISGAKIVGLSPTIAANLAKGLGVGSIRDLLELIPRRYIDLSRTKPMGELKIGEDATTQGKVTAVSGRYLRAKRHLLVITIYDGTGYIDLTWWNQPFRARAFPTGAQVVAAGRIERNRGRPAITNPFVERLDSAERVHVGRVIPVHPATKGVTPTQIRRYVFEALRLYGAHMLEPLPDAIVANARLIDRAGAIREMHFPTSKPTWTQARRRLVYEELFVLSTGLALRKRRIADQAVGVRHVGGDGLVDAFFSSLPFAPTGAQRRAVGDIMADLARTHPMNRLLQGEVGSGKTVVALAAALAAHAGGSQTALMAPTEVLAEQHYFTLRRLLEPLADHAPAQEGSLFNQGFRVTLLTGSVTGAERKQALALAASGEAMIVVGTHALIQDKVTFDRLGLAIVDEQHRFGVHQRLSLRAKRSDGAQPDTLIMTATPIPRTLALTLYGDLDVSTLDEMPPGRTPTQTTVVRDELGRRRVYQHIRSEVSRGRQGFVVCSLVDDSMTMEAKAAESEYERIRTEVFPDLRVGLIHGRMKAQQKDEVMTAMRAGEIDVLVATTVIEVGVDIPNATVMVIEDADRFGLSQLHQLRGRIGRGAHAAECFLFTNVAEDDVARADGLTRLRALEKTTDGFELAEIDLSMRGSGQLFGRGAVEDSKGAPLQAGRGDLRFAHLVRDQQVLFEARDAAFSLVDTDPSLSLEENRSLLDEVRRRFADRLDWLFVS